MTVDYAAIIARKRREYKLPEAPPPPPIWEPNPDDGGPNPQRIALESEAQVIGYGGQAGGGKTDLLLGLAKTEHKRATIFRRVKPNLDGIVERSRELYEGHAVFNEVQKQWRQGEQIVRFRSCQHEKDKTNFQGVAQDFMGFDEVTEFSESQVRFITGWNRSADKAQRCRIVMTFNPPTTAGGTWVIKYFAPWLDSKHPNPAKDGEIRYFATIDGEEREIESGRRFEHNGETITPQSRTFIRAKLADNPYLRNDAGYNAVLDSLPEPLRSQLKHGDFTAGMSDHAWQVIPTAWVLLAQERWRQREKPDAPLTAVGIDVSRGGADATPIAKRYDNYFDEVIKYPGSIVDDGPAAAELARRAIHPEEPGYINIDILNVGYSAFDSIKTMYANVNGINAGAKSNYRDKTGKLKMRNIRAEYHWRMREALDPKTGDDLALPPGNELLGDLCAPRYEATAAGIQIEPKDKIKERIGRSPDVGESTMFANMPNMADNDVDIVNLGAYMRGQ